MERHTHKILKLGHISCGEASGTISRPAQIQLERSFIELLACMFGVTACVSLLALRLSPLALRLSPLALRGGHRHALRLSPLAID